MENADKGFQCIDCNKCYKRKSDLNRHVRSKKEKIVCPICDHHFNRKDNFKTHFRRFHGNASSNQIGGNSQTLTSKTTGNQSSAPSTDSRKNEGEDESNNHEIMQSINNDVTSIKIKPKELQRFDLLVFYSNIQDKIEELIISHSPIRKGLKWYLVTRVEFTRERDGQIEKASPHFRSITYSHLSSEEFNRHSLNEAFQKMFTSKEEFIMKGSDWVFSKVIYIELCYVVYSPLKGGTRRITK